MQSILLLYLLVNTATMIILPDKFTAFHSSSICRVSRDPILDFKSEATSSSSSSSLPFPAKLVANICCRIPVPYSTELVDIDFGFGRPVYFELELLSLSAGLTILANAEPFIIAKGAASQRRRIFSSGESTEVPPRM
jgi:hypothetical protein